MACRWLPTLVFVSLLLAASGCGSRRGRGGGGLLDTGLVPRDTGVGTDTGVGIDTGPRPDGGACAPGLVDCGGRCVDLSRDSSHCGVCGNACTGVCSAGLCIGGTDSGMPPVDSGTPPDGGTCPAGELSCGGACVNPATDPANCGSCGNACSLGSACTGSCGASITVGDACTTVGTGLPSGGGGVSFTWTGRTSNHTPFSCGSGGMRPDVAIRWTPARSGMARIHAHGPMPSTDTMLAVFLSATCDSAVEIACNDDNPGGNLDSLLNLPVTGGTSYYIVVAPFGTTTPTVPITVEVSLL